jgi:uncharacterized SAM-binding protein YcdF (DUF218 family)
MMTDSRRPAHRRRWTCLAVTLMGAAVVVTVWLARERILPCVARWLDVGEPPRACDYVVVLPGGAETRPFVAAAMVKAGLARQALVPRVAATPDSDEGAGQSAHEIIRDVLQLRGVPRPDILLIGQDSTNTYTDAVALEQFLLARPRLTIAVVTHAYHTRRARWVFRRVLRGRADDLYMVAAPADEFDANTWWHCREGAQAYFSEYAKLIAYLPYYGGWHAWGPVLLIGVAIGGLLLHRRARRRVRGEEVRW